MRARHGSVQRGRFNLAEIDQKFFPGIICRLTQAPFAFVLFRQPEKERAREISSTPAASLLYTQASDIKCQAKMPIVGRSCSSAAERTRMHATEHIIKPNWERH